VSYNFIGLGPNSGLLSNRKCQLGDQEPSTSYGLSSVGASSNISYNQCFRKLHYFSSRIDYLLSSGTNGCTYIIISTQRRNYLFFCRSCFNARRGIVVLRWILSNRLNPKLMSRHYQGLMK